jgi:hypothetical protein
MRQQRSITITNTSRLPLQFSWTMQQLHVTAIRSAAAAPKLLEDSSASFNADSGSWTKQEQWVTAALEESGQLSLHMTPASGWLEPQQSLQLQLLLEPTCVGPVQLLCCCEVPAMSQLAGFVVEAVVEGLQVGYEILRHPQELCKGSRDGMQQLLDGAASDSAAGNGDKAAVGEMLLADFGVTAIRAPSELVLRVTNQTSISTTYRAWVARFPAAAGDAQQQSVVCSMAVANSTGNEQGLQDSAGALAAVAKNSRAGSTAGVPISTLQALSAPAQQQLSASGVSGAGAPANRSSSGGSLMQGRRTGSGNQQQRSGIAARLAAAVSAGNATAGISLGSSLSPSALLTGNPPGVISSTTSIATLSGPFKSSAGNYMMAARQVAAAAAAALGSSSAGCAVCVQPSAGQLPGWGCVELQLVAYSNLPGTYVDELCIQVRERLAGG